MNDLAHRVKAALDAEAEHAPAPPAWSPVRSAGREAIRRRSPARWIYAAGVVATAASVIGVLLVAGRDDSSGDEPATAAEPLPSVDVPVPTAEPVPTAWAPPGEEFALEDLGPAESVGGGGSVTLAALTRRIGVADHPPLTVYTSIDYVGQESLVEWHCLESGGGGTGCAPVDRPGPEIGVTSSVDNRTADFDLWTWSNVPVDAAYVVYGEGAEARWQTPVSGVAAFPNVDWFDSVAVAYDNAGLELARVDPDVIDAAQRQYIGSQPLAADLEREQAAEIVDVMEAAAMSCLTEAGAIFREGAVGELVDGDADAVWAECVAVASTAVEDWMAANEIRFFDPATESPEADEPFIEYGG